MHEKVAESAQSDKAKLMQKLAAANQQIAVLEHTQEENKTLFAEKAGLQKEVQQSAAQIQSLEAKCNLANDTDPNLLSRIREKEAENETLKQQIIDLEAGIPQISVTNSTAGAKLYKPVKGDAIDQKLAQYINNYPDRQQLQIMFMRESSGVYQFGSNRVRVEVQREKIRVKVGGGFISIESFLNQYNTPQQQAKLERKETLKRMDSLKAVIVQKSSTMRRPMSSPMKQVTRTPARAANASTANRVSTAKKRVDARPSEISLLEEQDRITPVIAIKKTDIHEIKALNKPSQMILVVFAAVATLLGEKTDWANCKKFMRDPNQFLARISSFDKHNVTSKTITRVRKFTS